MVVLVVWGMVMLALLLLAVPGLHHRRRVRAWESEFAAALGKAEQTDILPRRSL